MYKGWLEVANAAAWLWYVSVVSRDEVHVEVIDGLSCGDSCIDSDVVPGWLVPFIEHGFRVIDDANELACFLRG